MALQNAIKLIFPPQCIGCGSLVEKDFALCGVCWRDSHFISGSVCDSCGVPLPGESDGKTRLQCDDCLRIARPWQRGRAAMLYQDGGRKLVLALKHGDRLELARPAGQWLARAARPIIAPGMLVAPVPLHRWRLLKRRYNQSALLAQVLAREAGLDYCPDLLLRQRHTSSQDGKGVEARFANLSAAITAHPKHGERMHGRNVLLVDDVMTSGATLAACAEACLADGANTVNIVVLARVAKQI